MLFLSDLHLQLKEKVIATVVAVLSHKGNTLLLLHLGVYFGIKANTSQQWAATERNDVWNFLYGFYMESFGGHVVVWPDWPSRKLPCTWKGLCLISQPISHPGNAVLILSVLKIVSLVIEEFLQLSSLFLLIQQFGLRKWDVCCSLTSSGRKALVINGILQAGCFVWSFNFVRVKCTCCLWVWLHCFLLV